ncbi:MAG: hypothetical protein K6G04_00055 [Lachnospiraceae bacterium]|nr:hypothetical protein [Lachnospiraceae bacterium]
MKEFRIKDYGKKSTFASFLPGIAGIHGIPIWCYYVNRGQAVVSFGVENKDHSMMEFYPAHTAYQNVKRTGFRTFYVVDGCCREAFGDETIPHEMEICMNAFTIREDDKIRTRVTYFVLPGERVGALVRKVEMINTTDASMKVSYIDGMPALIPYGVSLDSMKNMAQLSKAWMQVEDVEEKVPRFRVRASMADTASVTEIQGANFALAVDADGTKQQVVVDPECIFAYDTSLSHPVVLEEGGIAAVTGQKQNTTNLIPGCFFLGEKTLAAGECYTMYELYGQVEQPKQLEDFLASHTLDGAYFEEKLQQAMELTEKLTDCIDTHTANEAFDAYTRYTYMDNVLRGGLPMELGDDKTFYVYSRKHGDLEREYNFFSMSPEFYSQGNGNFRDVNQNRRCDTFFHPKTGRDSIHMFYDLIQLDGYNPLSVEKKVYTYEGKTFTPGQLYQELVEKQPDEEKRNREFHEIMTKSTEGLGASFGEGYWCDHWTYNLDLVEEYLALHPEEESTLLTERRYTYFLSQQKVNPRAKRYERTANGIRQYHALDEKSKRDTKEKLVRTGKGHGAVYQSSLIEKLLLLCGTKFATLDPYGMGIEMEAGKPGWYDALNGLPGILGSSMAETYELQRMLLYVAHALTVVSDVSIFQELQELLVALDQAACAQAEEKSNQTLARVAFWNAINDAKEAYRDQVYDGIRGEVVQMSSKDLLEIIQHFTAVVSEGIEQAMRLGNGLAPTYFYYEVMNATEDADGIHPTEFLLHLVPAFLEGPVRYLKLPMPQEKKRALYEKVKASNLYDHKLSMYKVNESLAEASYEVGRCKCFTPGWLENESIWLHMEYKYLLEVLRSGLYPEFIEDFHHACVPFLDPQVYGRSILENSSFIASSANPNSDIHGKGFVARLSGSTIEFISIWKRMMFGSQPFDTEEGLCFHLEPVLPAYLLDENKEISAMFCGKTNVCYHLDQVADFYPGNYTITSMELTDAQGEKRSFQGDTLIGEDAMLLRNGQVNKLDVYLKHN